MLLIVVLRTLELQQAPLSLSFRPQPGLGSHRCDMTLAVRSDGTGMIPSDNSAGSRGEVRTRAESFVTVHLP